MGSVSTRRDQPRVGGIGQEKVGQFGRGQERSGEGGTGW